MNPVSFEVTDILNVYSTERFITRGNGNLITTAVLYAFFALKVLLYATAY